MENSILEAADIENGILEPDLIYDKVQKDYYLQAVKKYNTLLYDSYVKNHIEDYYENVILKADKYTPFSIASIKQLVGQQLYLLEGIAESTTPYEADAYTIRGVCYSVTTIPIVNSKTSQDLAFNIFEYAKMHNHNAILIHKIAAGQIQLISIRI